MDYNETILLGSKLKWSNYSKYEDHLSTYRTWPKQMKQDKHVMATAGFFYLKEREIVECFACGVRMSQWTVTSPRLLYILYIYIYLFIYFLSCIIKLIMHCFVFCCTT